MPFALTAPSEAGFTDNDVKANVTLEYGRLRGRPNDKGCLTTPFLLNAPIFESVQNHSILIKTV